MLMGYFLNELSLDGCFSLKIFILVLLTKTQTASDNTLCAPKYFIISTTNRMGQAQPLYSFFDHFYRSRVAFGHSTRASSGVRTARDGEPPGRFGDYHYDGCDVGKARG